MQKYILVVALILALLSSSAFFIAEADTEPPPVVLVTLESTRANNIPCYGYERNTAPNTCDLADDGVLFENGHSNGPHTLPSISSLMTSRYPNEIDAQQGKELSQNLTTLASLMDKKGYRTYAITHTYIKSEERGLDQGFDHYEDRNQYDSMDVVRESRKKVNTSQKFFLWAHMVDPHQGYNAPENFSGMFTEDPPNISAKQTGKQFAQMNLSQEQIEYIESRYDEEIRYSDYAVGQLLEWLKKEQKYEESLIIVVGDHGEDFMEQHEHIGHGQSLRSVYTHIPFIVKFPENRFAGQKVSTPVSLIDIMPTVEETVGVDFKYSSRGESLYDIIKGVVERRGVVSQMPGKKSLTTEDWKYIDQKFDVTINSTGEFVQVNTEKEKLYNLSVEIGNRTNIVETNSRRKDYLSRLLYQKTNPNWEENVEHLDPYLR